MIRSIAVRTAALTVVAAIAAPALVCPVAPGVVAAARQAEIDPSGVSALSERLARMAQLSLSGKEVTDDHFRQAAALLRAATKLNPGEPRFSRLLADAALQLNDTDTAIAALELYTKARPSDQFAKLQLIDLFLSQMQTAEKRLEYLVGQIVENASLPKEIRSAAAVRAARLHLDRDEQQQAVALIGKAVELEPLNPDAAALHHEVLVAGGAPAAQRVAAVLAMLRTNPAQPRAMTLLASELADVGLHDLSQQWYARAFDLAPKLGEPVDPQAYLDAAAGALVLGQSKTAETRAAALLGFDPTNFDAHLIRLLAIRRLGTEDQVASAVEDTTSALVERANAIHRSAAGADAPSTQPSGELFERIPDPAAEVKLIKETGNAQLEELYAETLSNIAWTQLVFANRQPEGQRALAALREMLPTESVVLTRLEGWSLLMSGKPEEARVKLSAVADRDPIARLGLIRLEMDADKAKAAEDARVLLSENPSGLLGAIIASSLGDLEVRADASPDAAAVRAALADFPSDLLEIIDKPSDFYALAAETPRVAHDFGQPILVNVTLKNNSKYDLSMGPNGTIRPDLWFDCSIRGVMNQNIPGVTFERLGGRLVLRRNEAITQQVRVDQGQLWQMLQSNPSASFPLFFSLFTNPVPAQTIAAPGPGGYRVQVRKPVERAATPIFQPQDQQKVFNKLALGSAGDKIRLQEMFAYYIQFLASQQQQNFEEMNLQLKQAVAQGMSDPDPNVSAWAGYVTTLLEAEPRKSAQAQRLADSSLWLQRLLVATATDSLAPEAKSAILENLSNDADPIVQQYATATKAIAARAPAAPAEGGQTTPPEPSNP